jgi:hypothetical protein
MASWIPRGLAKLRGDYARLAAAFDTLTPEQMAAIDALPEAEEDGATA